MNVQDLVHARRLADQLEAALARETARADGVEGAVSAVARKLADAAMREHDDELHAEKDEQIARLRRKLDELRDDAPVSDERAVRVSAGLRVAAMPLLDLEAIDGLDDREIMCAVLEHRGIPALTRSDAYVLGRFAVEVGRPWLVRDDAGDFDEDLHPRAGDGKFGSGGGAAAGPKEGGPGGGVMASIAERHKERIEKARVAAIALAKTERTYESTLMDGSIRSHVIPASSDKEAHAEGERAAKDEHETIRGEEHRAEVVKDNPHFLDAAKESSRLAEEWAKRQGHDEPTARMQGEAAHDSSIRSSVEEHDNNKADQEAIDAGHIKDDKLGEEFDQAVASLRSNIATSSTEMDATAREALTALGKFNQLGEAIDEGDIVEEDPSEAISEHLGNVHATGSLPDGHGLGHGFDDLPGIDLEDSPEEPEAPEPFDEPHPKESDFETADTFDEEAFDDAVKEHLHLSKDHAEEVSKYEKDLAEWKASVEARKTEQERHAKEAQTAFERLLAQQVAALESVKKSGSDVETLADKAHEAYDNWDEDDQTTIPLLNMKSFSKAKRAPENDDGTTFLDEKVEDKFRLAALAAVRIGSKRQEAISNRNVDLEDHITRSKEAIKATSATIKELAKITGIKPKLAKPAAKKTSAKKKPKASDEED